MRPVSIILPVIRYMSALRCIDAIHAHAGVPSDMYEIVVEEDMERIGCPKMVARLSERAFFDLVMFLGDDTIPQQDFLINAILAMETFPDGWGLVGLNDGANRPELPTHWLADKRLLPLLDGEFFHTGYRHCFCDAELSIRCALMGCYTWAENARIEHDHPVLRREPTTGTDYEWQYRWDNFCHDQRLFRERQRNGWK